MTNLFFLEALGMWLLNFDELAKHRPVYAIDLPGFGKSSRKEYSKDPLLVEQQLVKVIETWRIKMNITKMILLGPSMGGFIAASYAITFPNRVQHLILADPWGLTEKPSNGKPNKHSKLADKLGIFFSKFVNPLGVLRLAGPFGQWVIECTFADMLTHLESMNDFVLNRDTLTQYLNQINLHKPTGEVAFISMVDGFYWAKNPMIKRIDALSDAVPMTLILAEKSWIDSIDEDLLKKSRSNSYVNYQMIENVGHELFAYNPKKFNCIVKEACAL